MGGASVCILNCVLPITHGSLYRDLSHSHRPAPKNSNRVFGLHVSMISSALEPESKAVKSEVLRLKARLKQTII